MLCQAFALGLSPLLPLAAMAQTTPSTTATGTTSIGPQNTTILPTDVVPLADRDAYKTPIGELLQLKIMQRLPARLYFSSSVEVTGRNETNPFQFPLKRRLMADLPRPAIWRLLSATQQASLYDIIGQVARNNMVFRALPNVSGGWTLTPHTRLFTNYFMIRDQLNHSMRLNTVIHSYAVGLQQDIPLGAKGSMQLEFQGRELWQLHQQSVFDFLPGVTLSYIATPRTVLFVNALIQARGKAPFQAPTKELDPFYTWGGLYQKNGWTFSASTTFVQNFREPFHSSATIPKNSYVFISDFEIARRIVKQYPGLQAFCRAEPIWNFHSSNIPSLAGMDFRMFFGMRFAMAKPALTNTLNQIREQLKQEGEEGNPNAPGKPSADAAPIVEAPIAQNPQPIHGFLEADTFAETCNLPDGELPLIADDADENQQPVAKAGTDNGKANAIAEAPSADTAASNDRTTETASASAPTAVRTLDLIAKANNIATSSAAAAEENKVLDLSTAQIDWKDLEATPLASASNNKDELHSLLGQAEEQSNSMALQGRGQKLQELADKQEKEYKLAFAPPPVSIKPVAAIATPIPKLLPKSQELKALVATPQTLLPSNKKGTIAAGRSLATPEPSGLAQHSTVSGPSHQPSTSPQTAFVPAVQAPELEASRGALQPIKKETVATTMVETTVPLADIRSSKKNAVLPVPMISSKTALTPNAIPTPVSAKMIAPTGVLPSVKGKALVVDQSTSGDRSPAIQHIANKDGSIPVTEAKLDKFTGKSEKSEKPEAVVASASIPQTGLSIQKPAKADAKVAPAASTANTASAVSPASTASVAVSPSSSAIPSLPAAKPVQTFAFKQPVSSLNAGTSSAGTGLVASAPAINKAPTLTLNKPRVELKPAGPSAQQLRMEENATAVSGLDTEICSPKIAMAVYDGWQSQVLDDPLIGMESGPKSSLKSIKGVGLEPAIPLDEEQVQKQKQADKKRTDMRLIPPFPSANNQEKNSPLKDLQIPVLPVH